MRVGGKLKRKVILHWPLTFTCGSEFSNLFNLKIPEISTKQLKRLKRKGLVKYCNSYEDCTNADSKFILIDTWRFILLPGDVKEGFAKTFPTKDGKSIDLEYERISKKLVNEYLKYIDKLKPGEKTNNEIKLFESKTSFKNVIGLHIRRTEFLLNADGRGWVSSDEKFFQRMEEILKKKPSARFFLATDSEQTQDNFIREWGSKVIVFPKKDWDKSSRRSAEEALIDLLLLSRTSHILGTYLSTFTEMAWWIGKCKAKVEIVGDEKEKEKVLSKALLSENETKRKTSRAREMLKYFRRRSSLFRRLIYIVTIYKMKRNEKRAI